MPFWELLETVGKGAGVVKLRTAGGGCYHVGGTCPDGGDREQQRQELGRGTASQDPLDVAAPEDLTYV